MTRQVKCPTCGNFNDKENTKKYKKRYYCPDCYEDKIRTVEANSDGWEGLYEYIVELYGKKPTPVMFKQLSKYRKEPYNFTNEGMRLSLKYFYETMENFVDTTTSLGIIPYVYEDAKQNFLDNREINDYNGEFEWSEKTNIIKPRDSFNGKRRGIKKKVPINLDEIDEDRKDDNKNEQKET